MRINHAIQFFILAVALSLCLSGCPIPPGSPANFVVVPTSDSTAPTNAAMDVYDPDAISFNASSQPMTIIGVSDVVRVIAGVRDDDGGIKSVKIWATYTYRRPGQISGPGLAGTPVAHNTSNAAVGGSTLKLRNVAFDFDLKKELIGWSSIKVDVWVEGENFYGGKVQTPTVSITYPTRQTGDTDYMAYCRKVRVPIPPDFALSGTAWAPQGKLQTNLLQPGADANVWTYSDPVRRGACIALPRGGGGQRAGLSGIICQSATTGRACFWDSRDRDDSNPLRQMPALDWTSQRLRIAQLKDASNLTEPGSGVCTDCHRGNNAFLIAPDDPTWAKVLRGPLVTDPGSTFTTRVERSIEMLNGHARYIPVTYPANRPDWVNSVSNTGCAGTCHESPVLPLPSLPTLAMPPLCSQTAGGGMPDEEKCYK